MTVLNTNPEAPALLLTDTNPRWAYLTRRIRPYYTFLPMFGAALGCIIVTSHVRVKFKYIAIKVVLPWI